MNNIFEQIKQEAFEDELNKLAANPAKLLMNIFKGSKGKLRGTGKEYYHVASMKGMEAEERRKEKHG